ncbi:hypothetical protein CI102_14312 [Trichoderma harzianum]|uniref:BTB domain-containing protein n=1 Tax=Trichoderma harzianum CBS 226.95 TaxID=983964 RepID=A0A2T3ZWF8_TRIHA|nr:hypothetical protein M431DRAFT_317694 [Trichoderma harzianum CBS 226.95]PKK41449.1 hypothetical protein CI102_14312 [Trichoderma harzianum]PTB49151.1 hypothetical protein M431DRAFT_317694 [Trichoderma harzianum CBS 226.95]
MDSSMQVDLELRLKREEPAEEPEPTDLALTPEPPDSSEPSGSANTSEPAELSALEAAKADRAARNAKYRQDIADNNKKLAKLAEKISKMPRSPSPPAPPPLRKKRSHSELLCELILSQMKRGQWKPEDIVELLLGPTEEDGDGDSSSSSSSKLKGKCDVGDMLEQLKSKEKGKEKDEGKDKGKENDEGKGKDEDEGESEEDDEGEVKEEEKDVTEIISPGGDMILAIEGSNTAFLVYSQTLMCASASFEVLVEDIMCASGDHERILVLDPENIEIVRIICRIIHLQNHLVPRSFRPSMLLGAAILVNKYGLQRAVTLAARQWLLNGRDNREYMSDPPMASGCYMVAASLFWDEPMFKKCMWELISICTVPFERLWAWPPLKQELSQKAIKLLTMIRAKARVRVYQILLAETGLRCYAGWNRILQDRYESLLARYKPATTVRIPLAQVIFEVKKALFRELGGPSSPMDCL